MFNFTTVVFDGTSPTFISQTLRDGTPQVKMFSLLPNLPTIRLCCPGRPHHSQPSSYVLCQAWRTTPRILYICSNTGWKLGGNIYACLKKMPLRLVGGCVEEKNFFLPVGYRTQVSLITALLY